MLKIFIPNNFLPERKYIIDTIFNYFLGLKYKLDFHNEKSYIILLENDYKIIFKDAFFSKFDQKKSYLLKENLPKKVCFTSHIFTSETNIPVIFGSNKIEILDKKIVSENDIFASSFFMLTRWEELIIKDKDNHNRFPEELSFAIKNKIHFRPVVNEYVEMLWNMLTFFKINQSRKKQKYEAIITHDIDFIKRYDKLSKLIKAIGGDIILRKNPFLIPKTIKKYINIKKGKEKDLYDTFDYLMDISDENNLISRFYFIPGMLGETDVRYNITNNFVSETIKKIIDRGHIVGLHGTYDGYNSSEKFTEELERLKKIYPKIKEGRQHYLRFENPKTWQIWNNNNLQYDSTIGYSKNGGFRAGTCYEYPIFDLMERKKLSLIERPLIAMEGAIKLSYPEPKQFYKKIIELKNIVKKYNGKFVFLWHNSNINIEEWRVYFSNYKSIIKEIA